METQTGKTALITGATSGIGYELAKLFAKDGYNLVLTARHEDKLNEVAEQFRQEGAPQVTVIARDLMDPKAAEEIYDETRRQNIQVDVLVNNAGMGEYGRFATETDLHKELGIIQLNLTSLVHLSKLYLKDMIQRNDGKILNLASIVSVLPNPMMAVYGATKSFIYSFSEALRNELKDTNITVTALLPGATNTDFFAKAGAEGTRAHQQAQSADAADVAKDGYDALMKGKDKVISGFMNKAQVTMAHFLPDELVAANTRKLMERPGMELETEDEKDHSLLPYVLVGALATTALLWAFADRITDNINWYDKARYRYKARSAKKSLMDALHLN